MTTKANRALRAALSAGKSAKPHKYAAKPETVDGIRFASPGCGPHDWHIAPKKVA